MPYGRFSSEILPILKRVRKKAIIITVKGTAFLKYMMRIYGAFRSKLWTFFLREDEIDTSGI
jgi:uncharacterized membrane protein